MNLICVQNVRLKRKVFNLRLKISMEIEFLMSSGKRETLYLRIR